MNLIGVVNGLKTAKERNQEARRLLDWGYREFISQQFYKKGDIVEEAPTWLGKKPTVPLVVDQDVAFVISKAPGQQPKISVQYKSPVVMPVHKGQKVGVLSIQIDGKTHQQPLYAGESVPRKGFLGRMSGAVKHILWGRKAAKKTPDDQNTQDQRTKDITVIKLPPKAES
jgi:D-alanyl-D-alanine carboxypeptidase (penicillin-binding protein 5/6)